MISQTAEYALRAIVFLARHDEPATTAEIASATRVPCGYLSKVMQSLCRSGMVRSQRGLHGGFMLVKAATELTVLDVVNTVDPLQRIRTCPLDLEAHAEQLCPLHRRLDNAVALVEESFQSTTIDELLTAQPRKLGCRFPCLSGPLPSPGVLDCAAW
ncbi:MAG: Rrf2 family transcriptional regulator [Planctomycetes bacterium]|nr:Rrf2 family transcriptional regulator [Planctomycetota bacterium]